MPPKICKLLVDILRLSLFLAVASFVHAQQPGPDGFDIVLLIDDSSSMGTGFSTKRGTRSDPEGRRYQAANMILKQLYTASSLAYRDGQQQLDIRFSIIAFGSGPVLISDWQSFDYRKTPADQIITPTDRVWTDFDKALERTAQQFKDIQYGRISNNQINRTQVVILLTDGEPSISSDPDELYKKSNYWAKMQGHLDLLRNQNSKLRVFLVALNNPINDYWPNVEQHWKRLNVEPVVIKTLGFASDQSSVTSGVDGSRILGIGNEQLFRELKQGVTDKLYPIYTQRPGLLGDFDVPCFQARVDIQVSFYNGRQSFVLISPDGRRIQPENQSGYIVSDTYLQFDVEQPLAGKWQIDKYQKDQYDLTYTYIPFAVNYLYPGRNGELLRVPRKIKMYFSKDTGEQFTQEELDLCVIRSELNYRDQLDSSFSIPIPMEVPRIGSVNSAILSLESTDPFTPDPTQQEYFFDFGIFSQNQLIFSSKNRRFAVSSKPAIALSINQKAEYLSPDSIRLELALQLIDTADNQAVDVEAVFPEPDNTLVANIQCLDFVCTITNSDEQGSSDISEQNLKLSDKKTLTLTLELIKQGGWLENHLDMIAQKDIPNLDIDIKTRSGASVSDQYIFIETVK